MWVMTFHAMCVRMLRLDAELRRLHAQLHDLRRGRLASAWSKTVMRDLEIDEQALPGQRASRTGSRRRRTSSSRRRSSRHKAFTPLDKSAAQSLRALPARLRDANAMDFDDLLVERAPAARREPRRARRVPGAVPLHQRRRVPGHEPRAVRDHEPARGTLAATSWSWATTTSRSTRGAVPTSATSSSSSTTIPSAKVVKLEQNYRSTARILAAANAVVANNPDRKPKTLFTDQRRGREDRELPRHRRARRGALHRRRDRAARARTRPLATPRCAIFYRTNAQSRVLEDALLRAGVPYRIVGGTRFFDRAEIRDVMAYLKVVVNPADEISLKRIINTPRRGIGDTTIDKIEFVSREIVPCLSRTRCESRSPRTGSMPALAPGSPSSPSCSTSCARSRPHLRDLVEMIVERSGLIIGARGRADRRGRPARRQHPRVLRRGPASSPTGTRRPDLPAFMEWLALRTDLDTLDEGESTSRS